MKQRSFLGALALTAMAATPSLAGFVNGSFENSDLSGWSYRWGVIRPSHGTPGKWNPPSTWENDVTWNGAKGWPGVSNYATTPVKAASVNQLEGANVNQPNFAKPLDGLRQLMMNYKPGTGDVTGGGGGDVTEFMQKALVTSADIQGGTYTLNIAWSALLENPDDTTHPPADQPGFFFKLGVKPLGGVWTYTEEFHSGNLKGVGGWTRAVKDRSVPMWVKYMYIKKSVNLNDSVSVNMVVLDCSQKGHGAYGYLDAVGFKTIIDRPDEKGLPCIYGTDSLHISSRVKLSGDFGSGKGILLDADAVDTGFGFAMGYVNMRDRSKIVGNITYKGGLGMSNGASVTGLKTLSPTLSILPPLPRAFVTGIANQTVNSGNTLLLPPGNYRNITSNGGSIRLTAGTYNLNSLVMYSGNNSKLILDNTNGPIIVNMTSSFVKYDIKDTVILSGSDYIQNGVNFYTNGNMNIYSGVNAVLGSFDAPKGTITLDSRKIGGYVHGKRVVVNSDAKSTCKESATSF